ncbi:hypothetical protein [Haloarcula amylovorans]|nr:hypothetical protein [Halomicroarcula amylolytica]
MESEFDANLGEFRLYRNTSTGTNTDRSDYQQMLVATESGKPAL